MDFFFLDLYGLDENGIKEVTFLLLPSNQPSVVEFPWDSPNYKDETSVSKGHTSSLNVHAPAFESSQITHHSQKDNYPVHAIPFIKETARTQLVEYYAEAPKLTPVAAQYYEDITNQTRTFKPAHSSYINGQSQNSEVAIEASVIYSQPSAPHNGHFYTNAQSPPVQESFAPISSFKLNPTVSSFIPSNLENYPLTNVLSPTFTTEQPVVQVQTKVLSPVVTTEQPVVQVQTKVLGPAVTAEQPVVQVQTKVLGPAVTTDQPVVQLINVEVDDTSSKSVTVSADIGVDEETVLHNGFQSETENNNLLAGTKEEENGSAASSFKKSSVSCKDEVASAVVDVPKKENSAGRPSFSWADIVSKGQKPSEKLPLPKTVLGNEKPMKVTTKESEKEIALISEDKMSLVLGKHLYGLKLNFQPVLLQPRGLINRRYWCYINAILQALLACPPFYTLLRNLPLGPGVERGKSSTPVLDTMVKVTYEFLCQDTCQEELTLGSPFQPDFMYDMLKELKPDCVKGQQEDAEEFLSFILNNMHEEMVKIIKYFEQENNLSMEAELKENGDISDGDEEWQVIGSKHKGMVTRKVAEHKTPISELLGGQIKSFLTISGNKTSASIQPFFTLQLDIQADNVNSLSEALKEMTVKEPIQGYTCVKTKQKVEAFSHIALQKLPPILILHLKRFVYDIKGGCKKVMKKTDYPLMLEISKDMFSPDAKRSQRSRQYNLFAVIYHDGEEAIKGHYISDVYNHGSKTWIRCDDRSISAITEEQVLSHSPPRVPYLLFYQES